ncbi:hypothetical protein [Flavobacterium cerinum]|uniref:Uncharacterized protein n=1 Tax=Flavobacterium cerinum TaxID=2502784 RepID=A0A3S3U4M6_9FLAO|nr:hypothetical protein [Flavobacterium cerinum]RWX02522.1 hypothetical protein EPI11_04705 [Flavobacterium cerinum]
MDDVPLFTAILFTCTVLLTCFIFYRAANTSKTFFAVSGVWLLLQGFIALTGFYTNTQTIPPRFVLLIGVPLLFILLLFVTKNGRQYIDNLEPKYLTLLHVVRVPVEIVLYLLFLYKKVPVTMTFEGSNFDILSGISAPFIFYFGYKKKILGKTILLLWNFICIGLLLNVVITAVLSAPFEFQQFAFDQPNVAVLYFPYIWLPCCVVPLVMFSHLATIRQLLVNKA